MSQASYRSRSIYLAATIALAVLALRPFGPLTRALDLVLSPTRFLAELAAPFGWLRTSEVRAARAGVLSSEDQEIRASRALTALERRRALPSRSELLNSATLEAEVVTRSSGNLDQIVVRLASTRGVEAGLPVVSGDHFVGRIARLDEPAPGLATVDLVTADDFFVGARGTGRENRSEQEAEQETRRDPVRLVVGGLAPRLRTDLGSLSLAVHHPSSRALVPGPVVVHEPARPREPGAQLANGFLLGQLEVLSIDRNRVLRVIPGLDYKEGLYQLTVLIPAQRALDEAARIPDAFDDGHWKSARLLSSGDPCYWRVGRKLALGQGDGVVDGAALAFGARFAGRVAHAGRLTSDAFLLADVGLSVPASASLAGGDTVLVLGHLVSLGRWEESSDLALRWEAVVPLPQELPGEGPVRAVLYTGSGEANVPPGLLIGETGLPRGRGVFVLRVRPAAQLERLDRLEVRMAGVPAGGAGP